MISASDRESIRFYAQNGELVPIVQGGEYVAMLHRRLIDRAPLLNPLPVEDFIVGLEALGFAFDVHEAHPGEPMLLRSEPEWTLPASWEARAQEIMTAFGQGRGQEGVAFLRAREEA